MGYKTFWTYVEQMANKNHPDKICSDEEICKALVDLKTRIEKLETNSE